MIEVNQEKDKGGGGCDIFDCGSSIEFVIDIKNEDIDYPKTLYLCPTHAKELYEKLFIIVFSEIEPCLNCEFWGDIKKRDSGKCVTCSRRYTSNWQPKELI